MARIKNEIEFCTVSDMIEIAKEMYNEVKINTDSDPFHYEDNYRKKIISTLDTHIKNIYDDEETISKKPHNTIKVSKEIATFIVGNLLCDYFSKDSETARQRKKERIDDRMKKIKKKSQEKDRQLNETERELHEALAEITAKEYAGEDVNEEEFFGQFPHLSKKEHDATTHRYHLPVISLFPESEDDNTNDSAYDEFIEQTIDRMMLRALFDMFYDFNETGFRRDLLERSSLIIPTAGPNEYGDGYSELTEKLENPLGYYISRKKIQKKNTLKKPCFTLDPDTEKRLKQYASDQEIPVSKAIHDWIWNQPLKSDKEDK